MRNRMRTNHVSLPRMGARFLPPTWKKSIGCSPIGEPSLIVLQLEGFPNNGPSPIGGLAALEGRETLPMEGQL